MLKYIFYFFYSLIIHVIVGIRYKTKFSNNFYLNPNCKFLPNKRNAFFKGEYLKGYESNKKDTNFNNKSLFWTEYDTYTNNNRSGINNSSSTFVSKYYKININDVYNYLNRKKYEYIETDVKITLKYCPFCPPHKYKYDNMYKHEIFKNTGNSYCHRCGYKGSFYDFKLKMGDIVTSNFESAIPDNSSNFSSSNSYDTDEEKITFEDVKIYSMNLLYSKEAENARNYLINVRKIKLETLKKFYIGFSIMSFPSLEHVGKIEKHECLVFPFIKKVNSVMDVYHNSNTGNTSSYNDRNSNISSGNNYDSRNNIGSSNSYNSNISNNSRHYLLSVTNSNKVDNKKDEYEVIRIKVRSLKDKGYMRLYPKNVKNELKLFFFGEHLIKNSDEVVLTEGEIDAMSVYQETGYSAISLPNGSKSLPVYLLPYLEHFKKIHLWLDFDKAGKSSVYNFVNKIGLGRTNVITDTNVHYLNIDVFNDRKKKRKDIKKIISKRDTLGSSVTSDNNVSVQKEDGDDIKTSRTDCVDSISCNDIANEVTDVNSANLSKSENVKTKELDKEQEECYYFIDKNILYVPNNIVIKDANDCLKYNIDVNFFIKNSEKVRHSQILNFHDLRQNILEELKYPDRINGVKSKTIPSLNKFIYGLRMGELSIWTGSTGVGKTTILSQLSLDYCVQGIPTLWGSFEINNIKLGKIMLNQFSGKNLEKNIELFDLYADKFETLPLKFLKFHGSTNLDQVLDAMDYAVYAYDVKHIIIDNLQFMLNISKFSDIYEVQNIAIDKFRSFSTNKNVHITLVVHPRKEDNNLLSISSVFGSVKSTQEADNVFIIQKVLSKNNETLFFIDIKKNRFKGLLGRIPYIYNTENMTIKEVPLDILNEVVSDRKTYYNGGSYTNKTDGSSNFYPASSGATPVMSQQNNTMDFSLSDEHDYIKQIEEEYKSKYEKKPYRNRIQLGLNSDNSITSNDSNNAKNKILSSEIANHDLTNHRLVTDVDTKKDTLMTNTNTNKNMQNEHTFFSDENINKKENALKQQNQSHLNNSNVLKVEETKSKSVLLRKNILKNKVKDESVNGQVVKSGTGGGDIVGVTKFDGSVTVNNGSVTVNNGSVSINDGSVAMNDGGVAMNDGSVYMNDASVISAGANTSKPKKRTSVTYALKNDTLNELCQKLKECNKKDAPKRKGKETNELIHISMRDCVINNESPIKELRNFIKTNKLNIKTAGNNLKKIDVFISILESVPKEYITVTREGMNIVGDEVSQRSVHNEKGILSNGTNESWDKNTSNCSFGNNTTDKIVQYSSDTKTNTKEPAEYTLLKGNKQSEYNVEGKGTFDKTYESDVLSEHSVDEKKKKNYIYEDNITNKYIKDNIINVDNNILKINGHFQFVNDDKSVFIATIDYYAPLKPFDDKIETRFIIINDNNYNEKIKHIYKNIKYCGLDIETTGLDVFNEKIRLIQIAVDNFPVLIYDMFNINNEEIFKDLKEVLQNKNIIKITQNGKFDAKFLMYNNFEIENIFDTYIASKLLDKNKNMYGFKLNMIVEKYLNVILDKQQQNSIWNNSLLNNNQLFYAARDSSCLLLLYKKLKKEIEKEDMNIVNDIENKCILPICSMELSGISVDIESLNRSTTDILKEADAEKKKLITELGDENINVNSQQQVLKALQNKNVRDSINNKLIDNTSDANLKSFLHHKEVVLLRSYRRLYKMYSTFYLKLPLHINKKTNKIHTTFNQLKTFSGRFSSEKPNLQQIPRQKNIREIFIPSENNIFIIADFKQIELKIAAEITNDEIMLKAYNNNIDLHTLTASIMLKKKIDQINQEDRHIAKAINFGLIYGMNYINLKNYANNYYNLNMSLEQCLYFYNSFFEHYKGIYKWHNQIKQNRSLEYATLSNRKVVFPYFSFTKSLNYPVQGTCADILKLSLVELYTNLKHINGKIVLCVHDEIIIEVNKKYQDEAQKILVETMEKCASFFLKKVKCEVSVNIAENWGVKG
ncbi:plastid replication-repair enzyme [Hepatocystis sp. ex Piliocolobus tephrosceles]|nr:plastid replication-repair enzyme [Hepatocystis sp. ex Piliocolobus tephrosceles]